MVAKEFDAKARRRKGRKGVGELGNDGADFCPDVPDSIPSFPLSTLTFRFHSVIPAFHPAIPDFSPRHSREIGNPQTNSVILAKAGTSPPRETRYESRATNPFSLYRRFSGAGSRIWERGRPARNAALARGDTLILAFSRKGRRDPLASIRT